MGDLLGRILIRLALRRLGVPATLFLLALSIGGTTALLGLVTASCFGCMGGLVAIVAIDVGTATPAQATVTGHHWERGIRQEEAERGPDGKIRWSVGPEVTLQGDDLEPVWPAVDDDHCVRVGCRRPGTRRSSYQLLLRMTDGAAKQCTVPEGDWPRFAVGSALSVNVGGITGTVYCTGATPGRAPPPPPVPPKGGRRRR